MTAYELALNIRNGLLDGRFSGLYGADNVQAARERYAKAAQSFAELYGNDRPVSVFSVPGRSEISGNHTDHNRGKVIACSVDLDIIAVAAKRNDRTVRLKSRGFPEDTVDISGMRADESGYGKSSALIAGIADGLMKNGHAIGGFDAYTDSDVLKGSGISSSAAFEDMVGTVFSHLYLDGKVGIVELCRTSQYAENRFFGKPCGLMDQIACACGGFVSIDFADAEAPVIEKLGFDLSGEKYRLCLVNTGGNHADLTADYASVPSEMKSVAAYFGKDVLREVRMSEFLSAIPALREKCGDRAVLRAYHFFTENIRVDKQKKALSEGNLPEFLRLVRESGLSSFRWLQNVYSPAAPQEQGVSLGLAICENILNGCAVRPYACRVHGGGFAGTVQCYVPDENSDEFREKTEEVFGSGSCRVMSIRTTGACRLV